MKSLLTISLFILTVSQTFAQIQEVDSLTQSMNSEKIQSIKDSIPNHTPNNNIINQAQNKTDTIHTQLLQNQYTNKTDSVIQTMQTEVKDTLDRGEKLVTNVTDSLESWQKLKVLEQWKDEVLDSLKLLDLPRELKNEVDSLSNLPNLEAKLKEKLNKIDGGTTDSLEQKYLSAVEETIGEEQMKLDEDLLPESFNKKLQQYKSGGKWGDKINEVGNFINEKEGAFQDLKSDINVKEWINTDMKFLQDLQINPDKIGASIENYSTSISEYSSQAQEYVDLSSLNKELGGASDLNIDKSLEGLDQEQYQKLVEEYGSLSNEELDKRMEQQLTSKVDEVGELQQHNTSVDELKEKQFGEGMQQIEDIKSLQEKIAEKKENVLANDIAKENMDLIAKAEEQSHNFLEKYVNVDNSLKIDREEADPEHKVGFGKRILFGTNFQINPGEKVVSLDASPLLAYKINKIFIMGIGGTFRYDFNKEENYKINFNEREPEYGYRTFLQYKPIGSFFIHAEWERMSVYAESKVKNWEHNYLAGIGKDLTITKGLVFTTAILYNFNHKNNPSYNSPFMVRFGIRKQ